MSHGSQFYLEQEKGGLEGGHVAHGVDGRLEVGAALGSRAGSQPPQGQRGKVPWEGRSSCVMHLAFGQGRADVWTPEPTTCPDQGGDNSAGADVATRASWETGTIIPHLQVESKAPNYTLLGKLRNSSNWLAVLKFYSDI